MSCINCNQEYNIEGYQSLKKEPCVNGCSRLERVNASCVLYTGPDIVCLGIYGGIDTIKSALIKIYYYACENL